MKDFHCPHCNKKIELSEVAKKQAKILAAQEIKDAKKEAEKKANEDAQRKLDKKDLEIKEANQKAKNAEKKATEEAKKMLDKERKQKDLEIKDAKKVLLSIGIAYLFFLINGLLQHFSTPVNVPMPAIGLIALISILAFYTAFKKTT